MVPFATAAVVTAVLVVVGAVLQGEPGIRTLSEDLRRADEVSAPLLDEAAVAARRASKLRLAAIISTSAAATVVLMTWLRVPASTSQAVVGAIVGVGALRGEASFDGLGKVVACWIGTPLGGVFFSLLFYYLFSRLFRRWKPSVFVYDPVITLMLLVCGGYGAYALGANNVANISAVFVGDGMLSSGEAALYGGLAIAVGVITYSKPLMFAVGDGIVKLSSFSAFVAVLAHAVTVHIYAMIGVPVSSSQAIVGAIVGIGMVKGVHTINFKKLGGIGLGWLSTPFAAAALAALGYHWFGV